MGYSHIWTIVLITKYTSIIVVALHIILSEDAFSLGAIEMYYFA